MVPEVGRVLVVQMPLKRTQGPIKHGLNGTKVSEWRLTTTKNTNTSRVLPTTVQMCQKWGASAGAANLKALGPYITWDAFKMRGCSYWDWIIQQHTHKWVSENPQDWIECMYNGTNRPKMRGQSWGCKSWRSGALYNLCCIQNIRKTTCFLLEPYASYDVLLSYVVLGKTILRDLVLYQINLRECLSVRYIRD